MPAALHPGPVRRLTKHRVSVWLTPVQDVQMASLCALTGLSAAELAREGIDLVITKYLKGEDNAQ